MFEWVFQMKKGIYTTFNSHASQAMSLMNIKWFHTNGLTKDSIETQYKFIGCVSDESKMTTSSLASAKKITDTIMGFTNPETQMSPEYCAGLWNTIQNTKLNIGSPCFSDFIWMNQFMALVTSRKLKVDFVCMQWYGQDRNVKNSIRELKMNCLKAFMAYDRPIWLTRFALNPKFTKEKKIEFIHAALDVLEMLPYVHRYAWDNLNSGANALVDGMGYPNEIGLAYAGTEGFGISTP